MARINDGKLYIKKRTLIEWISILIVVLPLFYSFMTELLHIPNVIKFVSDFLVIVSLVFIVFRSIYNGNLFVSRKISPIILFVGVFFVYTFIGYLFNFESVFYYFWGARNNFRFFAAFLIFIVFFDEESAEFSLNLLDFAFWIHLIVTLYQYFVLGFEQDFLGGIFGTQKGCNGYVIAFMSIVISKSILKFMSNKESSFACSLKCAAALLVSALAELKVFFFMFIFILIVSAVVTSFSVKKVILMVLLCVLLMVAYTILVSIFETFENFLSVDFLINELIRENYASSEDLGRFTSVPIISDRFLTTLPDKLFGMGLGNCDTSTISIFNTSFYDRYVDIHYSVLSVAFMFIETGWIGLILYFSFFIICFVYSLIGFKKKRGNLLFNQIGIIMSILCLILLFYNSSLRTEAGYLLYFGL